jgi:hypothetical protein
METKKGFLILSIIGIMLIIISATSCIFGYLIRELWPTTANMYEIGIPYIIGTIGVTFFALGGMYYPISIAKKKIIEKS